MRYLCGDFSLDFSGDWLDTTEASGPFTLSKPEGVGALQFSIARYKGGALPKVTASELLKLLREFAENQSIGPAHSEVCERAQLCLAAGSFFMDGQTFGRVWYVSDGTSVAKITYVCAKQDINSELSEADSIVRSIRFVSGA